MAKKYLVSIDLNKNELQNAKIQNLASAPNNPDAGQIYYNTVDKAMYIYNGTIWESLNTHDEYILPVADSDTLGGVKGNTKGFEDTVPVKIDGNGFMYVPEYPVAPTLEDLDGIPMSQKGEANGLATLDNDGKVPSGQLPSYVDDVLEFPKLSDFPAEGETGKIYVAKDSNKTYRWGGTIYIEISQSEIHKFVGTIVGDGVKTEFSITHGLNTKDIIVEVYDSSSPFDTVMVDVERTGINAINISFAIPPIVGEDYKVVILA